MLEHASALGALDPDDLLRHDRAAPRYTSYPTAPNFSDSVNGESFAQTLRLAGERADQPLGLYVHIPFCTLMCTFCGCTTWVPSGEKLPRRYFDALEAEFSRVAQLLGDRRDVLQMHWGGGTPNFLDLQQTEWLMSVVREHFVLLDGAEVALEVNPNYMDAARVEHYASLGFNRISMGVQDFDPRVQEAIGRPQSFEDTKLVIDKARELGFRGINADLVYGLPFQSLDTLTHTMERVEELSPDRIASYSFAYVPWVKGHQKGIDPETLAGGLEKWQMFAHIHNTLLGTGYKAIGMDHFAKPDDELSLAQQEHRLRRSFQGYTVLPAEDVLGLGISAISHIGGTWAQNAKSFRAYCQAIEGETLATERGHACSADDRMRRRLIEELMCNFQVDWRLLSEEMGLDTQQALSKEIEAVLQGPEAAFAQQEGHLFSLTERGRPFVRNVAMAFDAYLAKDEQPDGFSRSI